MPVQEKITFGEMRASGASRIIVHCGDYKCGHSVTIYPALWPDNVLAPLNEGFTPFSLMVMWRTCVVPGRLAFSKASRVAATLYVFSSFSQKRPHVVLLSESSDATRAEYDRFGGVGIPMLCCRTIKTKIPARFLLPEAPHPGLAAPCQ